MTELAKVDKLETAKKSYTKLIDGQDQLLALLPDIGIDQIVSSALFQDKMTLEVAGEVSAGYMIDDVVTGNIMVSRDGTVTIVLGQPEIFWVTFTGVTKSSTLGITTQSEIAMENRLRTKAGDIMIQEALSGWILDEAKNNTQSILQDMLLKAGIQIKSVIISWAVAE